jgi:predicted aspartyl protease
MITLALASAVTALADADENPGSVRFRVRDDSDIVAPVMVNGRGPFEFLLDTGSTRSGVAAPLAENLGLRVVARTVVATPAGRREHPVVEATLELGEARQTVTALMLGTGDLGGSIAGLIGVDLLADRRFVIDYIGRRLIFHRDPGAERGGARVMLSRSEAGWLVTLPQRTGGPPLRLMADTGAAGLVLFAREGRPLPPLTPLGVSRLHTMGGLKVGRTVLLERLDIGLLALRDQVAILLDESESAPGLADGLLPLHLFARVTFDGPAGSLIVVPRDSKDDPHSDRP